MCGMAPIQISKSIWMLIKLIYYGLSTSIAHPHLLASLTLINVTSEIKSAIIMFIFFRRQTMGFEKFLI